MMNRWKWISVSMSLAAGPVSNNPYLSLEQIGTATYHNSLTKSSPYISQALAIIKC